MAGVLMKLQIKSVVDMTISPISKLDEIFSSEVYIHGVPWKVQAKKKDVDNSLAVALYCTKTNDDPSGWSATACATITLMSFRDEKNPLKLHVIPYVFNPDYESFGFPDVIQWDDLLNKQNMYVKDDTIQLRVEIMAEDPSYPKRSVLKIQSIDKGCDCGSTANFHLTVTNVKNLMAVRSPRFVTRGFEWTLMVFKCESLGVMLEPTESHKIGPCRMTMSVKLLSSKKDVDTIKKSYTDQMQWQNNLDIEDVISWDEMLKPKNGFVNNDSITLEVELRANKPDGDEDIDPNIECNNTAKVLMKPQFSTVHMAISPISKLTEVYSSEIRIHAVPWEINAVKNEEENSLAVYLFCTKNYNFSEWAVPAYATIKLLSFIDEGKSLQYSVGPYVFNTSHRSCGTSIKWDDLMNDENKYVQDDTIELKIDIVAEDPNYSNKSLITCDRIDKGYSTVANATFHLTVTNVKNLMAVRSSQLILCEVPWNLIVSKRQTSNLGVTLESVESYKEESHEVTMSMKLLSSKHDVEPVEKSATDHVKCGGFLNIKNVISWDEMLKPENEFVNNGSITLEVELKVKKPGGDDSNSECKRACKRRRLECSICLEEMDKQELSTTPCGHMFCSECITKTVEKHGACPMCKAAVQKEDLRCLYLSTAN